MKDGRGSGDIRVDLRGGGESDTRTEFVAKHVQSKSLLVALMSTKGMTHEFPARRVRALCRELGLGESDIIVKGDRDPALQDLLRDWVG